MCQTAAKKGKSIFKCQLKSHWLSSMWTAELLNCDKTVLLNNSFAFTPACRALFRMCSWLHSRLGSTAAQVSGFWRLQLTSQYWGLPAEGRLWHLHQQLLYETEEIGWVAWLEAVGNSRCKSTPRAWNIYLLQVVVCGCYMWLRWVSVSSGHLVIALLCSSVSSLLEVRWKIALKASWSGLTWVCLRLQSTDYIPPADIIIIISHYLHGPVLHTHQHWPFSPEEIKLLQLYL